ncbi:MAG: Fibronectin type domain protein, partial [Verrucomicrobiales bacterium]|nr:Fibronectin type domain protein [Verrucomicrobiales bacterium]
MKLNLKNRSRHLTGIAFFVFCIAANAGTYFQDFSTFSVGSTSFGDGSQLVSDHLGSVARIQDNTMRELTLTTGTNVRSAFKLPNLDGVPIVAFSAKWNSQIYGNAADMSEGLSFNFGQLNSLDLISTNYAQEAGYATGLCFSVRTATNNNPGFYLRLGTNTIASQPFNPVTQWGNFNSTRHFWEVDWHYSNGLTVRLDGTTIFTNISTAGFAPYADDRFAWAARTSSSSAEVRLDNIVVLTTGNLSPIAVSGPYTSSTNNGTASNAFDGNPATFWNGETNGWVEAGLATSGHQLWVFTITSANTADRTVDPKSWRIGARVRTSVIDGDVRVGAFLNPMETRAWMENWSIDDYSAYRISILTNNGHPSSTWIGDMHFYEYSPVSYSMNVATTPVLPVGTTISLSGTINPYNIPVNAIFEWGTTTNYGNTTPAQLIPGTNGNVTVNALLNFPEGVTYHYRLVGSNQLAVVTGTDATLQVIKPGVATTPITVKVVDNIRFRCVVDKKGLSFYTSTWFEWGLTTNYDHITPAQQVLAQGTSNEETITGLSPSATYHYRVAASNMVGITYGQDVAFQTVGSDISWTQANVESNWW